MGPGDLVVSIAGMVTGVIVMAFVSVALVKIFTGPVGQALGRRISHKAGELDGEVLNEVAALRGEVEQLQQRLLDAEERIDFSERLLARKSENVSERGA